MTAPPSTLQSQLAGRGLAAGYGAVGIELNADGSLASVVAGQVSGGSWTTSGNTICLYGADQALAAVYSSPPGNCFVATVTAQHVVLLSQASGASHRFVLI